MPRNEIRPQLPSWSPIVLHKLPFPSLLVGSRDGTVPPAQALRVCRHLPLARQVVLDGLGHLAHEEAPARVAGLIGGLAGPSAMLSPTAP